MLTVQFAVQLQSQHPDDYRWDDRFGANGILYNSQGSADSPVFASLIDGNDIYVGGKFTTTGNGIVKWDLNAGKWVQLGRGVNGTVSRLCKWGDNIVVAGEFTEAGGILTKNIALWNTKTLQWSTFGQGLQGSVLSMAVYNGDLYIGGEISTVNNKTVNNIARWNGNEWQALGKGTYYGSVQTMCVYNNELWVGGNFEAADGDKAKAKLAIWDGNGWKKVNGFALTVDWAPYVRSMCVAGGELFVAGYWYWNEITLNNGVPKKSVPQLVSFNGNTWSEPVLTFGKYTSQYVPLISAKGDDLFVAFAGLEEVNGISANGIARWNSQTKRWSALGSGLSSGTPYAYSSTVLETDGNMVVAGGSFAEAGGQFVNNLAMFSLTEQRWKPFSSKSTNGLVPSIATNFYPKVYNLNSKIIAIGPFIYAGENKVNSLAEWNGKTWVPIGAGIQDGISNRKISAMASIAGYISSCESYDNGFLIGGDFAGIGGTAASGIALYRNSGVTDIGGGIGGAYTQFSSSVLAVDCILADGNDVYIGGTFQTAGGKTVNNIARWDGVQWNDLGGGVNLNAQAAAKVLTIKKMPDGKIIAGGYFTEAGGKAVNSVAIWDGSSWNPLGVRDSTDALCTIRDIECSGNNVFIGGWIKTLNGKYMRSIAHWDGMQWNELDGGVSNQYSAATIYALKILGDKLYVGGSFDVAGNLAAKNVAVWEMNSKKWNTLGSGVRNINNAGYVNSFATLQDTIFLSGVFDRAGSTSSVNVAAWLPANTVSVENEENTGSRNAVINVFPNPARDYIEIHYKQIENGNSPHIFLYDALGKEIKTEQLSVENSGSSIRITTIALQTGLYTLRIRFGQDFYSTNFIISR